MPVDRLVILSSYFGAIAIISEGRKINRMNELEQLRQRFNRHFENWEIELPIDATLTEDVWFIVQKGWTIWTRVGIDADANRKYLDYYAVHRMTNDRHLRLYSDGSREHLPSMRDWILYSADASKKEKEAAKAEFYKYNQNVQKLLDEKGFVMTKDAHGSTQLNRWLLTCPNAKDNTERS